MPIIINNFQNEETISYHLPLLTGEIETQIGDIKTRGHIKVTNTSFPQYQPTKWPVVNLNFKALVQLGVGRNIIELTFKQETILFCMIRQTDSLTQFVRPMYIVCSGDDGHFQGPEGEDCSPQQAQARIILGAMLIQSFTADKMKEHGFGRKTFQLETDEHFEPICHIFTTKLTLEEAHSKTGNELWPYFAKEFMNSEFEDKDKCKWYSFMSFTRYFPPPVDDPVPKSHGDILKYTKGHTALGRY